MNDEQQKSPPPQEETGALEPGEESAEDASENGAPKIELNWVPRNKRSKYAATVQLITLLFMLAALLAIFMFKDRCGEAVSGVIFMVHPDEQAAPKSASPPKSSQPD